MKGNQEPMLYTTNAAVASLNHDWQLALRQEETKEKAA